MDCKYILIQKTYLSEDKSHTSYGIAAVDHKQRIVSAAEELSSNESKVAELVIMCNEMKLSLVHFWDVVEDFLD